MGSKVAHVPLKDVILAELSTSSQNASAELPAGDGKAVSSVLLNFAIIDFFARQ